jgi:hypothetical protein
MFPVISTLEYEPLWSVCPRIKTYQGISRPKFFLSLDIVSQPKFSLFGDFVTILNVQTLTIIFGQCVPIHNTYEFSKRKNMQKFKLFATEQSNEPRINACSVFCITWFIFNLERRACIFLDTQSNKHVTLCLLFRKICIMFIQFLNCNNNAFFIAII